MSTFTSEELVSLNPKIAEKISLLLPGVDSHEAVVLAGTEFLVLAGRLTHEEAEQLLLWAVDQVDPQFALRVMSKGQQGGVNIEGSAHISGPVSGHDSINANVTYVVSTASTTSSVDTNEQINLALLVPLVGEEKALQVIDRFKTYLNLSTANLFQLMSLLETEDRELAKKVRKVGYDHIG